VSADPASLAPPSPFLAEVWDGIECRGPALDLACGRGRNARGLIARGEAVVGIDRNADALNELRATVPPGSPLLTVRADLERGDALPAGDGSFAAVVVFRYLHRPLSAEIERVLRPGGWLVYETFTRDQAGFEFGPNRPEFLLESGELPELFPGLLPDRFEEVLIESPRQEALARLVARKPG
jgi:tellurite methyltransferase